MGRPNKSVCLDCGRSTRQLGEYYMVTGEAWTAAGEPDGMLCIDDLERRLGRVLVPSDFPEIPVNQDPRSRRSDVLRRRLGSVVVSLDEYVRLYPRTRHGGARPGAGRKPGSKNATTKPPGVTVTVRVSERARAIASAIGGAALTRLLEQHPGAELVDLRARWRDADDRGDSRERSRIEDAIEAWEERHGVGCDVDDRDDEGALRCRWCGSRDGEDVCAARLRVRNDNAQR